MASNSTSWLTISSWPTSRRSTDNPFHDIHGDPFDDRHATPLQNIERGSTRRMSTQTQQRNEFHQSSVSSKESRILENIRNGNEICPICFEAVRFTPARYLWHCKDCYVITHYQCALSWAKANRTENNDAWRCPQCKKTKISKPDGSCWCGNGNPIYDHSTIPNACMDGICGSKSRCIHGNKSTCQKSCHPGPCEYPCGSCADDKFSEPPNMSTVWGRFKIRELDRGSVILNAISVVIVMGCISIFAVFHIKWHAQPYRYPHFKDEFEILEGLGLLFIGFFYLALSGCVLIHSLVAVLQFFTEVLNGTPEQTGVRFKPVRTVLGGALITCTFVGIYILPIVEIIGGPDIYWYYQMKDSCEGFNTRVKMGTRFVKSKYDLHSLNASIDDQTFYLAPVLAPEIDSNATYQYFHRFSGNTANMAHLTVDVDIDNGVWRWGSFDGPDERTKWWATSRKNDKQDLPIFDNITLTEHWNGTIKKNNGHLWLPGYDVVIQGIERARKYCEVEPFIRVFDTAQSSHAYLEELLVKEWDWSPEYDPNIIMRTASFGHGRQRLDMCIKEDFYLTEEGLEQELDGVSNPSIVPLAIVAAYRMRMSEKDMLDCSKKGRHSGYWKSSEE
ncbi:97db6718-4911-40bf-8f10-bb48f66e51f3 [Sclerotinia trifoliorum]|uniref:97db6718-4911-40bf-8f10-bb48f66e51f3 n=1 Tax=Sclerotinia trifoliorum TaxID=28548 RepID=A0A8H2VMX3_9HELO|nr:97db6718-4911-40bf-8f10-bb48f66e51f3 [Sclerotinia trifoliorum]